MATVVSSGRSNRDVVVAVIVSFILARGNELSMAGGSLELTQCY